MYRTISLLLISSLLLVTSCGKNTPENATELLPSGTVVSRGIFTSNAHSTSGTVNVITTADNKTFLVFENFKTDNAPDLRVRISPDNSGSSFQEVGPLKAVNGNFSYELNSSFNHSTNNRVLIWCKPFSVLFGSAVLQ